MIICCLFLVACTDEVSTVSKEQTLEKMGYNSSEIELIITEEDCYETALRTYNKNISLLMANENFIKDNLDNYLTYINNYNSSIDETIIIVNKGITDYYHQELVNILNEKYYLDRNLERYIAYLKNNSNLSSDKIISNVNVNLDSDYYTNIKETDTSLGILMLVNKYHKLPEDYLPENLRVIKSLYNRGSNGKLMEEVALAFEEMAAAALLDNITITNLSAYRSHDLQGRLYNGYVKRDGVKAADTYSARPGHSEHETGLCLDVNNINDTFQYTEQYKWLVKNCYKYGFIERYPEGKEDLTGYKYESWHYRYVGKEIANYIHENNITFDEYYSYFIE